MLCVGPFGLLLALSSETSANIRIYGIGLDKTSFKRLLIVHKAAFGPSASHAACRRHLRPRKESLRISLLDMRSIIPGHARWLFGIRCSVFALFLLQFS